jgi:hypothetical protein
MLSYTYVTASCPPLRDGIESTSKSILVVPLRALPSLANPREACVSRASSPYRFARTWAQHPRAQGDPSSSVLRDLPGALRRRAHDLQDVVGRSAPARRRSAARCTCRTSPRGVRAVEDEFRVDPRDHWRDEELRGAALQALMSDDSVPADWLEVKVTAGWVTLTGEVKHQSDSDAAFAAVSRLAGVGGITNEIKVISAGLGA